MRSNRSTIPWVLRSGVGIASAISLTGDRCRKLFCVIRCPKQIMNILVKKAHGRRAPAVSETVEWAPYAAVLVGRRQRLQGLRPLAGGRFRPCSRKRCGKENGGADNKTRTVSAQPRKDADCPIHRLNRRNRYFSLNPRLRGMKEALSFSCDRSSISLSVMHRYVRHSLLPCQQRQL